MVNGNGNNNPMNDWKSLYPFRSNYIEIEGIKYHYLDEGKGEVLVMLHGNPTWSFYYRDLILSLRDRYRIIAPDHIGCGLSDKPQRYEYRLYQHIQNLGRLITTLGLKNITLIMHDWGGAIGMGWAVNHPESIQKIILFNTAAFHINKIPFRINICRIPLFGDIAVRGLNLFAKMAVHMACKKPGGMSSLTAEGYLAPYNSYANRIATLRFVQDIPMEQNEYSYDLLKNIEGKLPLFKDHPVRILWGEKDFCFNHEFLKRWREIFPQAKVTVFPHAGHYVVEDAGEEILPLIREFCG